MAGCNVITFYPKKCPPKQFIRESAAGNLGTHMRPTATPKHRAARRSYHSRDGLHEEGCKSLEECEVAQLLQFAAPHRVNATNKGWLPRKEFDDTNALRIL